MTDNPHKAFNELTTVCSYGLQSVAYLLESVQRRANTGDDDDSGGLAVAVYDHAWTMIQGHLTERIDIGIATDIQKAILLRIFNTMINLKVITLRSNIKSVSM